MLRGRHLAFGLSIAAVISAILTYVTIIDSDDQFGPDPHTVMIWTLINLSLLIGLVAVVSRRALGLWFALRRGSVGSQLQTRVLVMFSLLTITPALLVSVFSALFFHFGIQSWFNERINTALEESVAVAEAYLAEHSEIIRADAIAMANDLDKQMHHIMGNPAALNKIVNNQALLRSLTEGVVIQRNRIIAQTALSFALAFEHISTDKIERASNGDVVVWVDGKDKIRAFIKLHSLPDTYLLIGRLVDNKVLEHMDSARGAVAEYQRLKANVSQLQVQFSVIFGLVVLLLLLAAVWYGMHFAARLVIPITRLIKASEQVRSGDFDTKVPIHAHDDELATLGRAFNRMTDELARQRSALIEANRQLDERRRFSEAVLAGVSSAIIALDSSKNVTLYNRSAAQIFASDNNSDNQDNKISTNYITKLLPQLDNLLNQAERTAETMIQEEMHLTKDGKSRTLLVRITVERYQRIIEGFIVTFDDITELVLAQRNAAWSDVARRVAHEIKNPLTPIQLAAERLRRKYSKQISEDKDSYMRYIETISRHVGDIGKMVEEFVSFARMPTPVFAPHDIESLICKTMFSEQVSHDNIQYHIRNDAAKYHILADEQQLSRAFGNLLKNAAEAIESKFSTDTEPTSDNADGKYGEINIYLYNDSSGNLIVEITDNGAGFPEDKLHKLTEPYVTTREKGTGLGLAIVKKIIEDHKGEMHLENRSDSGARVKLIFPIDSDKNVT